MCLNATVDCELVKLVQEHVSKLSNEVEKMKFEDQIDTKNLKMKLNNVRLYVFKLKKRLEKIEHEHNMLKQQQSSTSVEVDQLTSNQEILQQGLSCAAVKIEQLKRSQNAVEDRVTELEIQQNCNVPQTFSYGMYYMNIFFIITCKGIGKPNENIRENYPEYVIRV